jgi:hypothetical protein
MEPTFALCQLTHDTVAHLAQLSVEICLVELRKGDRDLDTD